MLFPRFLTLGYPLLKSAWYAFFMALSIFNNAGFVIMPDGLAPHASDWWMCLPIAVGTFVGAIGFPVIWMCIVTGVCRASCLCTPK